MEEYVVQGSIPHPKLKTPADKQHLFYQLHCETKRRYVEEQYNIYQV